LGAFFHSSLAPVFSIDVVWPPEAISPKKTSGIFLINTFFLFNSVVIFTYHAIIVRAKKQATI
jgi:hypothetical protein